MWSGGVRSGWLIVCPGQIVSKTAKKRSIEDESSFKGDAANGNHFGLSEVQILVLIGLRQGKPNKTIACDLHIDDQDVVRHAREGLEIIDACDRAQVLSLVDILINSHSA
jgi:hypothetical protein